MVNTKIKNIFYNYSLLIISILLIIVFAVMNDNYLTASNLGVILRQASLLALLGMGQTVILLTGNINLSVGSAIALSTVIFAPMLKSDIPFILPVLLITATGMVLGLLTGLIVTKLNVPSFIATFAMNYIFRGVAWLLLGNDIIYNFADDFRVIGNGDLMGIPNTIVYMVVLGVILHILLTKTTWGSRVYFTGSNFLAAEYSGVKVKNIIVSAYVLGGLIFALTGVVYLARLNAAEPGSGGSYALDSIAVVLIGGTSIKGGQGGVFGTVIGAIIISTIKNGMNFLQVSSDLQSLYMGVIIILAVFMNQYVAKKKEQSIS